MQNKQLELLQLESELTLPEIEKTDYEYILGDVYKVSSVFPNYDMSVVSNWGMRIHPLVSTTVDYHNGIDLECPIGTEVSAMFNGEVIEAGDNWGLGNYVRIKHGNGIISIYGHLSKILVSVGQQVKQYDVIGRTGKSGNTRDEVLHLGLFINGQSVDPAILYKNVLRGK